MRPSSWNGVGAMANVPAAWAVSLVILASCCFVIPGCATWRRPGIHTHDRGYGFRALAFARPGTTASFKSPRRLLDFLFREEDFIGVGDDIFGLPSREWRRPAFHFHHP